MFKKILRSWVFWLTFIGIIGAMGGIWYPILGIPSACFLITSAVIQGYENVKAQEHIQKLYAEAIQQIEESRKGLVLSIEEMRVQTMWSEPHVPPQWQSQYLISWAYAHSNSTGGT